MDHSARHVRLCTLGRGAATALLCPGSFWHQAILLHPERRLPLFRFRSQSAPSISQGYSNQSERPPRLSDLPLCLDGKTLFKDVQELLPAHTLRVKNGVQHVRRYWQVYYHLDFDHTEKYFVDQLATLLEDSVAIHKRSDVPIGGYLSGGLDSTIIACLAGGGPGVGFEGFTGKFSISEKFDESRYARAVAKSEGFPLHEIDISAADFIQHIREVIYHLDYPVAGPGAFPQFMVSRLASSRRKVVLGGQGGDEIFGGYVRYLIAYFEQCIKAAINGTAHDGNFIVTYESIIPNLQTLREYKPLLQEFWPRACLRTWTNGTSV